MKIVSYFIAAAVAVSGCTSNSTAYIQNPGDHSTLNLCRVLASNTNQEYRQKIAKLLVRRGVTAEKCMRLIASDNTMAASIAVAGAAAAVGAAAANSGGGGGYYPSSRSYGVAWDQFYNQYYQPIWRCRDGSNGQFVDDYYCNGMPMVDSTWPGWSA